MKALTYLLIIQIKNRILSLKKKPALLVLYLFVIAMLLFLIVGSFFAPDKMNYGMNYADERIIFLIIAGLGLLFLSINISTGLSTGSTLFTMSDVGLLFVAPISPKKILLYGIISTLGKTFLASFFIFYQIGTLNSGFGYGIREILTLLLIYVLMIFVCQLISIVIYIFTNGNPVRKKTIQTVVYLAGAILIGVVLLYQRSQQMGIMDSLLWLVDTNWFGFIPIAGWSVLLFKGVSEGVFLKVLGAGIFYGVFSILFILLLTSGKSDYYEDVLLSTEVTDQKLKAAKEGRNYSPKSHRKIKIRENSKEAIKGNGAAVLAYRNRLERKRRSRFVYIDGYTAFACIGTGVAAYNMKGNDFAGYIILGILAYILFFMTVFGPLNLELSKPYIFLIPDKSVKKIVAATMTTLLKPCVDGVFIFSIMALLGGTDPLTAIFLALAYMAVGALYVGLTVLYQRVLGGQPNMFAKAFVGFGLLAVVFAPSIVSSIIVAMMLPESLLFLSTLPFIICSIAFTAIIFLACGDLLEKSDYLGK